MNRDCASQPVQVILFLAGFLIVNVSGAAEGHKHSVSPKGCGVLWEIEGDARILDQTEKLLKDPKKLGSVPCKSWIATDQGWVKLKTFGRSVLHLGESSFIQLADDIHLYKGQVYIDSLDSKQDLSIVTPAAIVTLAKGNFIILASQEEEATQLIALNGFATIENRFETSRKIKVSEGETSFLDFSFPRVVPRTPSAVSLESVQPKFVDLRVPDEVKNVAIKYIKRRKNKNFVAPVEVAGTPANQSIQNEKLKQNANNEVEPRRDLDHYLKLENQPPTQEVDVKAITDKRRLKVKREEDEKKRLIQELSRIQKD
jgi:hypothetical protein